VEGFDLGQRHELVIPEIANLRAAIDGAEAAGDRALALGIAAALEQYWVVSSPEEGRQRLTALLSERPGGIPPLLCARALRALGGATYIVGGFDVGIAYYREALEIFRELGDETAVGHMLARLASEAVRVEDREEALRLLAEADLLPASRSDEAQLLAVRAQIAWLEDRSEEALELLQRAADTAGEVGFIWWQGSTLLMLADYAFTLGRPMLARGPLMEVLEITQRIGDRLTLAYALSLAARLSAESGDDAAAGTWWGAVESESMRAPIAQWEAERVVLAVDVVRPTDGFAAGVAKGRSMTLTEAARSAVVALRGLVVG
jgi:tetratricopeptide (TPR) repeat protein